MRRDVGRGIFKRWQDPKCSHTKTHYYWREAKKVPEEIISKIDLPWRMIKGFRNMAIHEYFNIDLVIIWYSVKNDLPSLVTKVSAYLENKTP